MWLCAFAAKSCTHRRAGEHLVSDDAPICPLTSVHSSSIVHGPNASWSQMHLQHAVLPDDLADGGDVRLVDGYLEALAAARGAAAVERPYPRDVALRQYYLAVVDYSRFVVGRFWTDASVGEVCFSLCSSLACGASITRSCY